MRHVDEPSPSAPISADIRVGGYTNFVLCYHNRPEEEDGRTSQENAEKEKRTESGLFIGVKRMGRNSKSFAGLLLLPKWTDTVFARTNTVFS